MRLLGAIWGKLPEFQELGKSAMHVYETNIQVLVVTWVQKLPGSWNSIKIWLWRFATFNVLILSSEV